MTVPTDSPLAGQVAVVTGSGRGIGAAIAVRMAGMGASVVVCGRTRSTLETTARSIAGNGGRAEVVECDVANLASVQNLAAYVEKTFGRTDILVNNAAIGAFDGALHSMDPEEWHKTLQTNLSGVFYTIRSFAPMMVRAKQGHIINISSLAGKNALPNGAAYAATKWGLNGLSYSVAEELRGHGVRVEVVCPGSVDTQIGPHTGRDRSRMLKPDDVAHVIAMLVTQSPQSFASEVLLRPTQKP